MEELWGFVSARLREVITDPDATALEKTSARASQKWYAFALSEARAHRAPRGPAVDGLIKDARKWRKHPDYDPSWED